MDVSVAIWGSHPSGDDATDATYRPEDVCLMCHRALGIIRSHGYRIAMTNELNQEWRNTLYNRRVVSRPPASRAEVSVLEYQCEQYARAWFQNMTSTKRVDLRDAFADGTRLPLDELTDDQKKDAHLVESALSTDRRIVSRDKKVRWQWVRFLDQPNGRLLAKKFRMLPRIVWADPELHEELCLWLENDAPDEPSYRLGAGVCRVP